MSYLIESEKKFGEKNAVINSGSELSYSELLEKSKGMAYFFRENGVERGDKIVISLGNSIETIVCFFGAFLADAVVSIIDHNQTVDKIEYIINDAQARIFVSENKLISKLSVDNISNEVRLIKKEDLIDILSRKVNYLYSPKHLDIDLACIIYTSGSTGEPKGVMLTHRNMLAASSSINSYLGNTDKEIVISALPLSFDYGLYQMIMMISVGGTLLLEKDFVLPSHFLKLIEKYRPSALPVVPSMVLLLQKFQQLKSYDLTSIRYITNTGAALMRGHISILKELCPSADIFSMYGLTECKRCTYLPPKDIERKPDSIGIPIPNTEMWVVDENGIKVLPNQLGEIVVRGQTVMKGYLNKKEATEKRLKPGILPGEYVLYTGDYGRMDEDGYFYFYGRIDEVIKSRGLKVSPREVEATIIKHADVLEIAALGVEHNDFGQALVLFASSQSKSFSGQDLMTFCKQSLQVHQQPVEVFIFETLPKTTNGKIDKKSLKEKYADLKKTA